MLAPGEMLSELETEIKEILHKYKPALRYIGVDFSREDVQEALLCAYDDLEAVLQRVIEYWYQLQQQNRALEYPSACLIQALQENWTPKSWKAQYLDNPNFKSPWAIWWEEAGAIWGETVRNELIADVNETEGGYQYILFTNGATLPLKLAQVWGWKRVLEYANRQV